MSKGSPVITFRMPPDLLLAVDGYGEVHGCSRTEILLEAVRIFLAERNAPPRPDPFPTETAEPKPLSICFTPE